MRRAVDGNPYLKAAWQKTEKVAEFTGDKAADLGDSCFGENDQSNTVYEIKERDPDFSMQEFLIEVREVIVPEVLQAYLTADQKTTEARCQGQAYSVSAITPWALRVSLVFAVYFRLIPREEGHGGHLRLEDY